LLYQRETYPVVWPNMYGTVHATSCAMGLQPFYVKGPRRLLGAGSRAARAKMTVSGIPNCQIIMNFL